MVQPATLDHIVILRGRFFVFGKVRRGERREVRTDEKAHYVVDRGADVGADDVVWGCGVRQAGTNLRWRPDRNSPRQLGAFAGRVVSPWGARLQRQRLLKRVLVKVSK